MKNDMTGSPIPATTFKTRRDHEWADLTSEEVFAGKTVVVFALPGAFTPTCSSTHVPRYNQLAPLFRSLGVDEIVCLSVNDAFVMNRWQQEQNAWNISFLPDGTGEFTEKMGMLVNKDELGFGDRSWRYSMLVKDGIIDKMFVEPKQPGDPFGVSDADTMLSYLAPEAEKPVDVTIFSRDGCAFCYRAKGMLAEAGIEFEELLLNRNYEERTLRAVAGTTQVPQIFINGTHIGDSDALETWITERNAVHKAA